MDAFEISRKRFLHLCAGAAALGVLGCDSDDDEGTGTDGGTTGSTSSTDPSDPSDPTDPSDPSVGTSSGTDPTGETTSGGSTGGEGSTGSSGGGDSGSTGGDGSTGGSSSTGAGELFCENGAEAIAVSGHPHGLSIPEGMLQPGTPLTGLNVTGNHPHVLDLSADDVDALLAGQQIVVNNVDDSHSHDITIACSKG